MKRQPAVGVPSLAEVVVIALGAQRVARAVSTDEIAAPLRRRVDRWAETADGRRRVGARWTATLLSCPVCTGWWASLALSCAWPGRARLRRGISVAGAQVLLAMFERWISERGRASIHEADLTAARSNTLQQPAA
jgi:hypothetical protein